MAAHLRTLTRMVADGRHDVVSDELATLLGRQPKDVRWALQNNPRIQKLAAV
ncbi:hypothetical protein [Streptomyces sp. ME19-01-6]|uniref:hypothetical protein n=1 Tax=Streptomyces sp. ME19-01-6 TaxID=3028686 RepID=UPI0029A7E394|nr:hypothetical protein [Streptomyces sp. ME19-01-6]MDX3233523.1 hypothetical protein [Streptomyces sp. ME19-01-6]